MCTYLNKKAMSGNYIIAIKRLFYISIFNKIQIIILSGKYGLFSIPYLNRTLNIVSKVVTGLYIRIDIKIYLKHHCHMSLHQTLIKKYRLI